jgi:hypothetical protein
MQTFPAAQSEFFEQELEHPAATAIIADTAAASPI